MTPERLAELRYRAKTDLYWLATEILDNKEFIPRVHKPMCDFYVKKKPGLSLAQQDTIKERLMLVSRGHFKTTVDEADIIQWILLEPNVRILIMSGKAEIVEGMIKNIKGHFQENEKLRALFPELCPPADKDFGNTTQFTIPGRTRRFREPTVLATAGESVKAGLHFDVIKGDDLVNEVNTNTIDLIRKTTQRWTYTAPIVEPYGYRDLIGTPYAETDLYANRRKRNKNLKTFFLPVWTVKDQYKEHLRNGGKLLPEMVSITFPERFGFDWLNDQRLADNYIFNCQYLLDPVPEYEATFTQAMIDTHRIHPNQIPHGTRFQRWDIGFTQQKYSDYSVGVTGLFDSHGNLFIIDVFMAKLGPHDLINAIITQAVKWKPNRVGIEEASGSKLMLPSLEQKQRDLQVHINFDWFKTSPTKHKTETIAALQPLMRDHKIYFSTAIDALVMAELSKQFTKFPKYAHDDGPDAIAGLLDYRGFVDMTPRHTESESEIDYDESDYILGAGLNGG
jgi:predicted phage terminase large subunit-like protein